MKKFTIIYLILLMNLFFTLGCFAETVVYNIKTSKFHSTNCQWANKCTVNCIKIDRKEAIQRGGVPCKVCRGGK